MKLTTTGEDVTHEVLKTAENFRLNPKTNVRVYRGRLVRLRWLESNGYSNEIFGSFRSPKSCIESTRKMYAI